MKPVHQNIKKKKIYIRKSLQEYLNRTPKQMDIHRYPAMILHYNKLGHIQKAYM